MSELDNNNSTQGEIKISNPNISSSLNLKANENTVLKLTGRPAPNTIKIDPPAEEGILKIKSNSIPTEVEIANLSNAGTLKIKTNSVTPQIEVEAPKEQGTLKIKGSNNSAVLDIETTATFGKILLNSVFISDLSIETGEVVTLPYGSEAYVRNAGDRKHAILEFGIPEGAPGSAEDMVWGHINGDIQNQTDLQEEFATKADDDIVVKSVEGVTPTDGNVNIIPDKADHSGQFLTNDGTSLEWRTITSTTYIHTQGVASDTWIIHHNLDKYPIVTVTDSANTVVDCAVNYVDKNTCVLQMNGEFKGKAYLN